MWEFILILLVLGLLVPTAYAGLIGAPYAPTWLNVVRKAFDAIHLGENDTLIDLGAGDGRIVLEAARRGARATGYELSPIMFAVAWLRTRCTLPMCTGCTHRECKKGKVAIRFGNFYKQDISQATVIFAFLMPKNMPRLKTWLAQQPVPRARYLLAYTFPLPDTQPEQTVHVAKEGTIYIYDLSLLTKRK